MVQYKSIAFAVQTRTQVQIDSMLGFNPKYIEVKVSRPEDDTDYPMTLMSDLFQTQVVHPIFCALNGVVLEIPAGRQLPTSANFWISTSAGLSAPIAVTLTFKSE